MLEDGRSTSGPCVHVVQRKENTINPTLNPLQTNSVLSVFNLKSLENSHQKESMYNVGVNLNDCLKCLLSCNRQQCSGLNRIKPTAEM